MTTLQVTSEINIELNKVLDGMARLDIFELERFLWQASILLAQRKAPNLPKRETKLLQKINRGLPATLQKRYDELTVKLRSETLEAIEHQELLKLIEQTELADAERMKHLIELAGLRNVSLDVLMNQLDIHPPPVHA
ncbi:MAG: hypothetical protein K8R79_11615 [Calditrichales bacterium]|nr:hypothetical protein [Calditrichales bacterium]